MKLSGNQLFIIVIMSISILAAFSYLDRTLVPVLVGILLSVVNIFIHINGADSGAANVQKGISIGVPLQQSGGPPA